MRSKHKRNVIINKQFIVKKKTRKGQYRKLLLLESKKIAQVCGVPTCPGLRTNG